MRLDVVRYSDFSKSVPEAKRLWNHFCRSARNGCFLFERDFMEYHADRFEDYSLVVSRLDTRGNFDGILALLPANRDGSTLYSHQGLTFGGLLLGADRHPSPVEIHAIFEKISELCIADDITCIVYKPMPYIYQRLPSQEDIYWLWRLGGELMECNLSLALRPEENPGFSAMQRRFLKKDGNNYRFEKIKPEDDGWERILQDFYDMLCATLSERHEAVPVHSFAELKHLMRLFPDNIHLWLAYRKEEDNHKALGGVVIFESPQVAHCQYIASTEAGRRNHALPALFDYLINTEYKDKAYFDFGTSNERHGLVLNTGLSDQKNSFGATGVAYPIYKLNLPILPCGL